MPYKRPSLLSIIRSGYEPLNSRLPNEYTRWKFVTCACDSVTAHDAERSTTRRPETPKKPWVFITAYVSRHENARKPKSCESAKAATAANQGSLSLTPCGSGMCQKFVYKAGKS